MVGLKIEQQQIPSVNHHFPYNNYTHVLSTYSTYSSIFFQFHGQKLRRDLVAHNWGNINALTQLGTTCKRFAFGIPFRITCHGSTGSTGVASQAQPFGQTQTSMTFGADWWFGTCLFFRYIGNVIIPTDELIFFRGVG
jgi:hypothetical protein